MWGDIAIAFLLAFIVTFMTTPYTIKIAKKVGAVDVPKDERRMHKKARPRFGGPAVILGFLVAIIYLLIVKSIENTVDLFGPEQYGMKLLGMFLGIVVISIFCVFDDIFSIRPIVKLLGQVIAAIIVVSFGVRIDEITPGFLATNELKEVFSVILTIGWMVGVTNAINLIDGLDGLSTGISVISAVSLLIIFVLNESPLISILLITALAGALVGFLPFNFAPAKTFIGDTGSNFLGFSLSIISILGAIFKADKGHLHHLIVARGFSQKQAVLILYGIAATFGLFAIIMLESGIWKALSFLLMVIVALGLGYKNFQAEKYESQRYECVECKYNPKSGNEKAGIKPGTEFEDLPDTWVCPVCGEGKDMFEIHR